MTGRAGGAIAPACPTRGSSDSGIQRWGKLAAAIAALLAVAAIGAILVANRQQGGPTPGGATLVDDGRQSRQNQCQSRWLPHHRSHRAMAHRNQRPHRRERRWCSTGWSTSAMATTNSYAIDVDSGLIRWDTNLRKPMTRTAAVSDGIVVVGTSASLFGLDSATGDFLWQRDDLVAASDPTIFDSAIYLVDASDQIRALDLETGADRWTSDPFAAAPALAIDARSGRMLVTTPDGMLIALASNDGERLWEVDPGLGALGSPLVDGDLVALPVAGGVALVDGATGAVGRRNMLGFESFPNTSPVLALVDDLLLAATDQVVLAYKSRHPRSGMAQSAAHRFDRANVRQREQHLSPRQRSQADSTRS